MGVADITVANSPITFAYAATNSAVAAWVFPTNRPQNTFRFPNSNTRQIVILNTGANALLFGLVSVASQALLPSAAVLGVGIPYAFPAGNYPLAAAGTFPVTEGDTCTRIPAGASFCGPPVVSGTWQLLPDRRNSSHVAVYCLPPELDFLRGCDGWARDDS